MQELSACLLMRAVDDHRNPKHELKVLLHRLVPRGRSGGKRSGIAELGGWIDA